MNVKILKMSLFYENWHMIDYWGKKRTSPINMKDKLLDWHLFISYIQELLEFLCVGGYFL